MAGEWIETTIGEQATLQRGMDITKVEQSIGDVPVVSSGGISSYHNKAAAKGPGVVLGRKGVVGSVYFVPGDYWPHDTTLWVKDFHGNDPRFVYYFFKWMAPRIATMDVGSSNPTLNRNHVHPIEVRWPPLDHQRNVARILGDLDDKIELNRRMSETLDAMARALFKSWFVDFDPVRAKAEGRATELPANIDELFPDSFETSDTGDLPDGWVTTSVYELGTFINGAAYSAFEPNDDRIGLPIIKIAELKAGVTAQTRFSAVEMPQKYRISDGDLLFSWSGNPDTSIDTFVWGGGPAWLNQHIFRVVSHSSGERAFVLTALRFLRPTFAEIARNKQTTGLGHVTVEDLKRLRIVAPPRPVLFEWTRLAEPVLRRVEACQCEATQLSGIRDRLLSRLLCGELSVAWSSEKAGIAQ